MKTIKTSVKYRYPHTSTIIYYQSFAKSSEQSDFKSSLPLLGHLCALASVYACVENVRLWSSSRIFYGISSIEVLFDDVSIFVLKHRNKF